MAAKREKTATQGTNGGAERIEKQEHEIGYLETLTEKKNEKEQRRRVWASNSTYME